MKPLVRCLLGALAGYVVGNLLAGMVAGALFWQSVVGKHDAPLDDRQASIVVLLVVGGSVLGALVGLGTSLYHLHVERNR